MAGLAIVGGVYLERCIQPLWNAVYGSGGRAAQCVSLLVPAGVKLHAYVAPEMAAAAEHLAADCGAQLLPALSGHQISFDYLHPLSTPVIRPAPARMTRHAPITVSDDVVLRYGMLEGDAIVDARVAIYDPQSAFGAVRFQVNGSRADRVAVVMNRAEAHAMTGTADASEAAHLLVKSGEAEVVIVKMGGQGALVATRDGLRSVPVYRTGHVWKLGSGDVFSATFAALWGAHGMEPLAAADLASRATAAYCENRALPTPSIPELEEMTNEPVHAGKGMIYLAGPFFDIAQRWLVMAEVR